MRALLEQCVSFLSSMTKSLADLADLTEQQDEYFTSIITGAPFATKLSFDVVIDAITWGVDIANGLKKNELAATKAMGSMLTDTIHAILRLVELDSQVTPIPIMFSQRGGEPSAR